MVRVCVTAKRVGTIADLGKRSDLDLVTDSQDVREIKGNFGNRPAVKDFDGFFVHVGEGEYDEVYGFEGSVPYMTKNIYKVEMKLCGGVRKKHR